MKTGIYKITCVENNRFYIGSAKNLEKRWLRHLNDLIKNKHINIHIQRAYNKYGEKYFIFEIVELCNYEDLLIREQFYLDELKAYEVGFNIGKNSSGGDNMSNHPNKEEIVHRIKQTISENLSLMTEEERKEKWGKTGILNPNYGNKWSEDMKQKASEREKNNINNPLKDRANKTNIELYGEEKASEISNKLSIFASQRTGDKNPFFNKKHKPESKDKISIANKGKKPNNRIKISINDIIYDSYHDASKALNIPIVTIRWRCLSKNPNFINYKLI